MNKTKRGLSHREKDRNRQSMCVCLACRVCALEDLRVHLVPMNHPHAAGTNCCAEIWGHGLHDWCLVVTLFACFCLYEVLLERWFLLKQNICECLCVCVFHHLRLLITLFARVVMWESLLKCMFMRKSGATVGIRPLTPSGCIDVKCFGSVPGHQDPVELKSGLSVHPCGVL